MSGTAERRLEGKVGIITGAGSRADGIGNGRATAITLARQGALLTLVDQNAGWVERTAVMVREAGGECQVVLGNVTDAADCARIVQDTEKKFGRVDILVNNVGISGPRGNAVEVDPDEWDAAMQVNVKSMMLMAKYAIPEMRRQGAGAIVNIASYAGYSAAIRACSTQPPRAPWST